VSFFARRSAAVLLTENTGMWAGPVVAGLATGHLQNRAARFRRVIGDEAF